MNTRSYMRVRALYIHIHSCTHTRDVTFLFIKIPYHRTYFALQNRYDFILWHAVARMAMFLR